jgi:hypothetical protein
MRRRRRSAAQAIAEEAEDRAEDYSEPDRLERIADSIEDPIERFAWITAVHDAPNMIEAVRLISRQESRHRRRRWAPSVGRRGCRPVFQGMDIGLSQ